MIQKIKIKIEARLEPKMMRIYKRVLILFWISG
jgi:hypothetical protein